jgi:hypothetical protein
VEYRAQDAGLKDKEKDKEKDKDKDKGGEDADAEMSDIWKTAVQSKNAGRAADFELEDYWDHGDGFKERNKCPVAITLNVVRLHTHFLISSLLYPILITDRGHDCDCDSCSYQKRTFSTRHI